MLVPAVEPVPLLTALPVELLDEVLAHLGFWSLSLLWRADSTAFRRCLPDAGSVREAWRQQAPIRSQRQMRRFSCGVAHTAAVVGDQLITWGFDDCSQCCRSRQPGSADDILPPGSANTLSLPSPVAHVACGGWHTLAVTRCGRLFACGRGAEGQLGLGPDNMPMCAPAFVSVQIPVESVAGESAQEPGSTGDQATVSYCAAGQVHSFAGTTGGASGSGRLLWAWGSNEHGRCGVRASATNMAAAQATENHYAPLPPAPQPFAADAVQAAANASSDYLPLPEALALVDDDEGGWCVPCPRPVHMPNHHHDSSDTAPPAAAGFVQICAGFSHTLMVTSSGVLCSWGSGQYGKLGHRSQDGAREPKRIAALCDSHVTQAAAGTEHSVCVTKAGEAYTFGRGAGGRLGHYTSWNQSTPRALSFSLPVHAVACSAGPQHTVVVADCGSVYSFGKGKLLGTLDASGLQHHRSETRPVQVPLNRRKAPAISFAIAAMSGSDHVVVAEDSAFGGEDVSIAGFSGWMWGERSEGQVPAASLLTPIQLTPIPFHLSASLL